MEKKKKGIPSKQKRLEEEEVSNNSFDGSGGNSKRRNSSEKIDKDKRAAKKKERPHKQKRLQQEDLNNNFVCAAANTNASSSSSSSLGDMPATLDQPMVLRPLTRSAQALCYKTEAESSQSRIPVPNIHGNSSEKHVRFESNTMDEASHVAAEDKDTHSELKSVSPDEVVKSQKGIENQPSPRKNELDLEKFTSDPLAQTQLVASPCPDELMVNNNLAKKELNVVLNISANGTARARENPTTSATCNKSRKKPKVMPDSRDTMINVEGYKVKKETVPLLKAIFSKYGDIARESTFSMESRSCLLELVCSIYKRLEDSKFMQLTPLELESMLGQIGDLKLVKVDVGWLHKRLDQISKARQMYDGASTLEDLKVRSVGVVNEKQIAVEKCEEELQACMADAMKLQEKLQREEEELAAAQTAADEIDIYGDCLVRGLV